MTSNGHLKLTRPCLSLPLAPVAPPSEQDSNSDGDHSSGSGGLSKFRQRVFSNSRLRLDMDSPKKLAESERAAFFSFPDPVVNQQGEEILQNFVYDRLFSDEQLRQHLPTLPQTSPFYTIIRTSLGKKLLKWNLLPLIDRAMECCCAAVDESVTRQFAQVDLDAMTQVKFYRGLVDAILCEEELYLQVLVVLQASSYMASRALHAGYQDALAHVLAAASDLFRSSICPKVAEEGGWEKVMRRPLVGCPKKPEKVEAVDRPGVPVHRWVDLLDVPPYLTIAVTVAAVSAIFVFTAVKNGRG